MPLSGLLVVRCEEGEDADSDQASLGRPRKTDGAPFLVERLWPLADKKEDLKKVAEHRLAPRSVPQPSPSASRMMAISDSEKTAELLFRFSAQKVPG